MDWIKKWKFDSISREELEDIVGKELEKKIGDKKTPVDRSFRRDIRPLRSKPASRKLLRALEQPSSRVRSLWEGSKSRGDKPNSFKLNKIYEEHSCLCSGYCSVTTINARQFTEHKNSAKHQLKIELSSFRNVDDCLCGKLFETANEVYKYRKVKSCKIGKGLLN